MKDPLRCLYRTKSIESAGIGDVVFFTNIYRYGIKHYNGESSGFYTVCCGEKPKVFTTLGLSVQGMSAQEITEVLRSEYNKKPLGMTIVPDEIARRIVHNVYGAKSLQDDILSEREFLSLGGGAIVQCCEFKVERIAELSRATVSAACELYKSWS